MFRGGEIDVAGGAMNNLPVDVMQERRRGPVIGVDVGADRAFTTNLEETDLPPLWRLAALFGGKRRRPNILQILWRTLFVVFRGKGAFDKSLAGMNYLHEVGVPYQINTTVARHNIHPVSYTHLRAHETVLDLVCRLLLEKKKTNQNNDTKRR